MAKLSTCPRFDDRAEETAKFDGALFPNSSVVQTSYYTEGAPRPAGSVLTVQFELDGSEYLALNGGPVFRFSPVISLTAYCDTQQDVDRLWQGLSEGGRTDQCGWLMGMTKIDIAGRQRANDSV